VCRLHDVICKQTLTKIMHIFTKVEGRIIDLIIKHISALHGFPLSHIPRTVFHYDYTTLYSTYIHGLWRIDAPAEGPAP